MDFLGFIASLCDEPKKDKNAFEAACSLTQPKNKKITLIENPGLQIVWCLAVGLAKSFRPIFGNFP